MEAAHIHLRVELLHDAERVIARHAKDGFEAARTRLIVDNLVLHKVKLVHKQFHCCWYHLLIEFWIKQIGLSLCIKVVVGPISSKSKISDVIIEKHLHHH
jgi:hypothetical protein